MTTSPVTQHQRRNRRSPRAWFLGIAFILLGWLATATVPSDASLESPFAVSGAIGTEVTGRNLAVAVTGIQVASSVADQAGWQAEGTWVVVDVRAQALITEDGTTFGYAALRIGSDTYYASERPVSMRYSPLAVGIPAEGVFAFEVPAEAVDGEATLEFALMLDARLDSLLEVPVNLGDAERVPERDLPLTGWAQS